MTAWEEKLTGQEKRGIQSEIKEGIGV